MFGYVGDVRNRFAVVNTQFPKVLELSVLFPFFVILVKVIYHTAEFLLYFFLGLCNICHFNYYEKKEVDTFHLTHPVEISAVITWSRPAFFA